MSKSLSLQNQNVESMLPLSYSAGITAALVDVLITYPLEYTKIYKQLSYKLKEETINSINSINSTNVNSNNNNSNNNNSNIRNRKTWINSNIDIENFKKFKTTLNFGIYTGISPMITSSIIKTITRYNIYNIISNKLGNDGLAKPGIPILAGSIAGFCESLVIIPFENIKVTMIDHKRLTRNYISTESQFLNPLKAIKWMFATRGIRSFFQGSLPTLLRQIANSGVRFSTFSFLKHATEGGIRPGEKIESLVNFSINALACTAVVALTQPLDVIKTRMQSIHAKQTYRDSLRCAMTIYLNEGAPKLWAGVVPRYFHLLLSGIIVAPVYLYVSSIGNQNSKIHQLMTS